MRQELRCGWRAKAAKASNETLYRHFGDKNGLFTAIARRNARSLRARLDSALAGGDDPLATLEKLAPLLLGMLLEERPVLLNRAAAGDPTGGVGQAIADGGRNEIAPRIGALLERARDTGQIHSPDIPTAVRWFLHLLIGDRQNRRVIGVLGQPTPAEVTVMAREAMTDFRALTAAPAPPAT